MKELGVLATYQLGDRTTAITNAKNNVFSEFPFSNDGHLKIVAALTKSFTTIYSGILLICSGVS